MQLSQQVNQLQARLEASESQISRLTKLDPSVIFTVQLSHSTVTYNHLDSILFDQILINEGGGYSPIHGEFTAPLSGYYFVNFRGWGFTYSSRVGPGMPD
nr:hypothetical protein BaRGS_014723 [Batillaria attramentaria]